jgi:hypothetical protein
MAQSVYGGFLQVKYGFGGVYDASMAGERSLVPKVCVHKFPLQLLKSAEGDGYRRMHSTVYCSCV